MSGAEVDPEALLRLRFVAEEARRRRPPRTTLRPGPFVTRRRGRGSETDDVRPWAHGDDVRHLDRNVTARTGEPHVRTFRDERERTTLLLADFRPPMLFGTRRAFLSVAAAEFLALVGWSAAAEGGRIGLIALTAGGIVALRPAVGERAMIAVVGALAKAHRAALEPAPTRSQDWFDTRMLRTSESGATSLRPDASVRSQGALADRGGAGPPLEAALVSGARMMPPGGLLVAATALDAPGAGFEQGLGLVGHRAGLFFAIVSDAFERDPPPGRYPFVEPSGRRGVGSVAAAGGASVDPRLARLDALGVPAALLPAEAPPERMIAVLEALHDAR